MSEAQIDPTPMCLSSPSGLRAQFNANGSLRRFDCDPISLLLFVGNELEGGPANLYLRRHAVTVEWTPLLGPAQSALTSRPTQPPAGWWASVRGSVSTIRSR